MNEGTSLVVQGLTLYSHCRRLGFNPWSGNYIPNATTKTWQSQINKLNKFKKKERIDEEKRGNLKRRKK